jgi:arylsulfatase A-like enzyme
VLRDNVELGKEYNKRGPHGRDILDDLRVYYGMIENLDDNVGRLVSALQGTGHLDNTVIALTADHGELLGSDGLLAKQQPSEESLGIPLIVSGAAAAASVIGDPVCTEDLYPTLLGLAGVTPRDPKPGVDLSPLIRGEAPGTHREGVPLEFVAEMRPGWPYHDETWRGIRTRRYKYTVLGGTPWQFFDLKTDPYEQHNLVEDPGYGDQVAGHHQMLRDLLVGTYDHYVLAPAFGCPGLNEWKSEATHERRFG